MSEIEPRIEELAAEPTVAVRVQLDMSSFDLGAAFGLWLPRAASTIAAAGGAIAGPAFGRYHEFGPHQVDVEIGYPAADAASLPALELLRSGEIGRSELPGGPAAIATHRGPYDGLPAVYDALHAWIHAQSGVDDGPGPWESYVDAPDSVPLERTRTNVVWPLIRTDPPG